MTKNYVYIHLDYTDGYFDMKEARPEQRTLVSVVPIAEEVWERYQVFKKDENFWYNIMQHLDRIIEQRREEMDT
jgi:uncharacterized protein (DUF1778 family)